MAGSQARRAAKASRLTRPGRYRSGVSDAPPASTSPPAARARPSRWRRDSWATTEWPADHAKAGTRPRPPEDLGGDRSRPRATFSRVAHDAIGVVWVESWPGGQKT